MLLFFIMSLGVSRPARAEGLQNLPVMIVSIPLLVMVGGIIISGVFATPPEQLPAEETNPFAPKSQIYLPHRERYSACSNMRGVGGSPLEENTGNHLELQCWYQ